MPVCRYLLKFSIWGDEALLCENFLERNFVGPVVVVTEMGELFHGQLG